MADIIVGTHLNEDLGKSEHHTIRIEQDRLQQALAKLLAQRSAQGTAQLDKQGQNDLPLLMLHPYGYQPLVSDARRLPQDPTKHLDYSWLVELQGLGRQMVSIRLEICGDVVCGVRRQGSPDVPDLDLGMYAGDEKGVSRQHAVLRPSRSRLYIFDKQSTNGTRVNAITVFKGFARELHDGDTISLGELSFVMRILADPEQMQSLRAEAAAQQADPDSLDTPRQL